MGVSTSLYSGLSGLIAHQRRMDVIGNNIANVNTPGFRSSRVLFRNAFSQTLSIGTAPSGSLGGVNPIQVGLGTTIGATSTNFNQGSIETTSVQNKTDIRDPVRTWAELDNNRLRVCHLRNPVRMNE